MPSANLGYALALTGTQTTQGQAITTDGAGNVYVAGVFQDTIGLSPDTTLSSAGGNDIFLAKYSGAGVLLWAQQVGSTGTDQVAGVAVDASGNTYIDGMLGAAGEGLPAGGFVAKVDSSGSFVWGFSLGAASPAGPSGIAADAAGNFYVVGSFSGTVTLGFGSDTSTLTAGSGSNAFAAKFTTQAALLWADAMGSSASASAQAVAVDPSGNVSVGGSFNGTGDFDPGSGVANLTSNGNDATFLMRLGMNGTLLWARGVVSSQSDYLAGLATDANGNLYATGGFHGSVNFNPGGSYVLTDPNSLAEPFVLKWSAGGAFVYADQFAGSTLPGGIAVDGSGNAYFTGDFNGTANFNPGGLTNNLTSVGLADNFVTKLSSTGSYIWAAQIGGKGYDASTAIALDSAGDIYTTGTFGDIAPFGAAGDAADFDPGPGSDILKGTATTNAFLSKWVQKAAGYAGALDPTFGNNGQVFTNYTVVTPRESDATAVAVQSDGKILQVGYAYNGTEYDFALARLNANGTFDTSFGGGAGKITYDFVLSSSYAAGVLLQSDGKILVYGSTTPTSGGTEGFAVVRFNADGSVDTSYGTNGQVVVTLDNTGDRAASAVLLSGNRLVIAGYTGDSYGASYSKFAAVRLTNSGALDGAFAQGGELIYDVGTSGRAFAIATQSGDRIVLGGDCWTPFNSSETDAPVIETVLVRFDSSGNLDPRFGNTGRFQDGGGRVFYSDNLDVDFEGMGIQSTGRIAVLVSEFGVDLLSFSTDASSFGVQAIVPGSYAPTTFLVSPDDSLLIGARYTSGSYSVDTLIHTDANGNVDVNFYNNAPTFQPGEVAGLAVQSDGKILVAGAYSVAPALPHEFSLTSLTSSGSLDNSFNSVGSAAFSFGTPEIGWGLVFDSAQQPDGKIVVVGEANDGTQRDILAARYNSDGTLDTTFGGLGYSSSGTSAISLGFVEFDFDYAFDSGYAVAIQADGKIVLGGTFTEQSGFEYFALLRLSSTGRLDTSFNGVGYAQQLDSQHSAGVDALAIQPDGRIVATGYIMNDSGTTDLALARFQTDGSLDTSFGSGGVVFDNRSFAGTEIGTGIVVQSDGKIVVSGYFKNASQQNKFVVLRYSSAGVLDSSFGSNGATTSDFGGNDLDNGAALTPTGQIVTSGQTASLTDSRSFAIAAYNSDGTPNTSFNATGQEIVSFGNFEDDGMGPAVSADGTIVVGGMPGNAGFEVARLLPNGSLDTSFNGSGEVVTAFSSGDLGNVLIQPDGKVLAVGSAFLDDGSSGYHYELALERFTGIADPLNITLSNSAIPENSTPGTVVGTLGTTWFDGGFNYTYTLTNSAGGLFTIVGNQLEVASGAVFNFQQHASYGITVSTVDAKGITTTAQFVIMIGHIGPSDITLSNNDVAEYSPVGTVVGRFSAGPYAGDTATYTLYPDSSTGDNAYFTINSAGQLLTTAVFDYDTANTYTIGVLVTDAQGLWFEKDFDIHITYVPPPAITTVLANRTGVPDIEVRFSEPVVGADQIANYQLASAGPDGLLGTSDDLGFPIASVVYSGTTATLECSSLPVGVYRLTASEAITSPTGEPLDGDGDGHPGGSGVHDVVVPANAVVNLTSPNGFTFDVQAGGNGAGQMVQGTSHAFDGFTRLQVGGTDYGPSLPSYSAPHEQEQRIATTFSTNSTTPVPCGLSETFTTSGGPVRLSAQMSMWSPGTGNSQTGNNVAAAQLVLDGVLIGLPQYSGAADDLAWQKNLPIDLAVYVPNLAAGSHTLSVDVWSTTGQQLYVSPPQNGWENQISAIELGSIPGFGLIETAHEQDLTTTFQTNSTSPTTVPGLSETFTTTGGPLRLSSELTAYLPNINSVAAAQFVVDGTPVGMPQFAGSDTYSISKQYVTFDLAAYLDSVAAGSHTVGVLLWSPTGQTTVLSNTLQNHLSAAEIGPSYGMSELAHEKDLATTFQTSSSHAFVPVPGLSETFTTSGGPVRLTAELTASDGFNFNVPEAELILDGVGVGAIQTSGLRSYNTEPQYMTFDLETYLPSLAAGTHTLDVGIVTSDGYTVSLPSNLLNHVSAVECIPILIPSLGQNGLTVVTPQQTSSGLNVHRDVTVPTLGSQDFARTVEYFQNPTSDAITTTVHLVGNLGSDAATQVFATSSGDSTPSPADLWVGTDGGPGTTAVITIVHGPAGLMPTTEDMVGDNMEWTYTITVQPGQTLELATFTIQANSEATAIAEANTLLTPAGFGGQAAEFLSSSDLAALANFQFLPVVSINAPSTPIPVTGTGTFTISRNISAGTLQVALAVDGSSTAPAGYTLTGSNVSYSNGIYTLAFADGDPSETITFTPATNSTGLAEAAHTLQLDLQSGTSYQVSTTQVSSLITVAANGFFVTNTSASGDGSLAQAIANADADTSGTTIAITFDAARGDSFATPQVITLDGNELPVLTHDMIITGPSVGLTISGANLSRVFEIGDGSHNPNVTLSGLTIAQGYAGGTGFPAGYGGGVFDQSSGVVTLTNCTLTDNFAAEGGGLYSDGAAVLIDCTISNNVAQQNGGGLANDYLALTLINCTVANNSAGSSIFGGGGIFNYYGTLTMGNCTLAGNTANGSMGGGILNGGQVTVNNTIVAGNLEDGLESDIDNGGTISGDYNLTGDHSAPGAHSLTDMDPRLSALANHGGPTETFALLPGSPAINGGNNAQALDAQGNALIMDQRGPGFSRIVGDTVDIGAFEYQTITPVLTLDATGNLTFTGPAGSADSLTISLSNGVYSFNDSNPAGITVNGVGAGNCTGAGTQTVTCPATAIFNIAVHVDGLDSVNLQATGVPTTITDAVGGSDTVVIGSLAPSLGGTLANMKSPVQVSGGGIALTVDDSGDATARTATLSNSAITGLGNPGTISYNTSTLSVVGPKVASMFNIQSTAVPTTVTGGAGNDTFNVGSSSNASGVLDGIQGALTVSGGGATADALKLFDQGESSGQNYALAAKTLSRPGMAPITWGTVENVVLNTAGSGNNSVTVTANATVTTKVVGNGSGNTLYGPNLTDTWTINTANGGTLAGKVTFSNFPNLVGGSSNDTFKFSGAAPSLAGTVDGGSAGTDKLDYTAYSGGAISVALATRTTGTASLIAGGFSSIDSLAGSNNSGDTLTGTSATTAWALTALNGGKAGTFAFSGMENLEGGSGADTFKISNGKGVGGSINASGGADVLDYSAWTTAVTVNLQTGLATAVGGTVSGFHILNGGSVSDTLTGTTGNDIIRGNAGDDVINGNGGNDILIGGTGNDTLSVPSSSGRSILIGSQGGDHLTGGTAGCILVGGYTSYDSFSAANDTALNSILNELLNTLDNYTLRISKIRAGVGTGRFTSTTVHDDATTDVLTGQVNFDSGDGDWFWAGVTTNPDSTNAETGEHIN